MTTTLLQNIGLRPSQWKAVEKKARDAGKTTREYVRQVIERDLLADKSFAEMLRPVRDDVRKSGISEDQLEDIVREARMAHPKRRRARR
jgi:hypothetical protein